MDSSIVFMVFLFHCQIAKTHFSFGNKNGNEEKHGNWFIMLKEDDNCLFNF